MIEKMKRSVSVLYWTSINSESGKATAGAVLSRVLKLGAQILGLSVISISESSSSSSALFGSGGDAETEHRAWSCVKQEGRSLSVGLYLSSAFSRT